MNLSSTILGFNWVDGAIILVVLVCALLAFARGLVRELLSAAAWLGAVWIAHGWSALAAPIVGSWTANVDLISWGSVILTFVAALILLSVVTMILHRLIRSTLEGGADRVLGLVFGAAKGAALVAVAYIAMASLSVARWPDIVQQARLLPLTYHAASWMAGLLPPEYRPFVAPPPARSETGPAGKETEK